MAQLKVRDIDSGVVTALKRRAQHNQRSLEEELRQILRDAVAGDRSGFLAAARQLRAQTGALPQSDSVPLLREDRDR